MESRLYKRAWSVCLSVCRDPCKTAEPIDVDSSQHWFTAFQSSQRSFICFNYAILHRVSFRIDVKERSASFIPGPIIWSSEVHGSLGQTVN